MVEICGDSSSWDDSQLSETACVREINNDGTPLQDEMQDEMFSQLSQDTLAKFSNAAAAVAMEQVRIFFDNEFTGDFGPIQDLF